MLALIYSFDMIKILTKKLFKKKGISKHKRALLDLI